MNQLIKLGLIFFLGNCMVTLYGQQDQTQAYQFKEIVIERYLNDTTFIYNHHIKKGETVFGLAQLFGLKSKDIFKFNPHLKNTIISIGENIKIPLKKGNYSELPLAEKVKGDGIPIIYIVQPKENLFRIARIYFDQTIEDISKRNGIKGNELSVGQRLTIGWIHQKSATSSAEAPIASPTEEQKMIFSKIIEKSQQKAKYSESSSEAEAIVVELEPEEAKVIDAAQSEDVDEEEKPEGEKVKISPEKVKPVYTLRTEKGLAVWKRNSADTENLFALHPTAKVNTMIEITNPMLNRKVTAKVIGNLPDRSYPDSVKLVVTPKVANELGVMDSRFFVELRYLE